MNQRDDAAAELARLAEVIRDADERLEALLHGQADSVTAANGRRSCCSGPRRRRAIAGRRPPSGASACCAWRCPPSPASPTSSRIEAASATGDAAALADAMACFDVESLRLNGYLEMFPSVTAKRS